MQVEPDPSGRSVHTRLVALLKAADIPFELLHHPACRTSAESHAARSAVGRPCAVGAKALIVRTERPDRFAMLVLPGPARLSNLAVRQQLGRFRFATSEEVAANTEGLEIGTIPPLGAPILPQIGALIVDTSLFGHEWIGFNAAMLTCSIVMKSIDYAQLPIGMTRHAIAAS